MRGTTISLAALLLLACGDGEHSFAEAVSVEPGGELEIELLRGDVRVRTHQKNEVRIEARVRGDDADRIEVWLEQSGSDVEVATRVGFGFPLIPFFLDAEIELEAWVPPRYHVTVETERGSIELTDVDGEVELETSRAPVKVRNVTGDLSVHTSRAPIEIEQAGADVRAHTSRAPIEIRGAGGGVDAETSRAPVFVRYTGEPSGRIETSRAPVEIRVPKGTGFDLDAQTSRAGVELGEGLRAGVGAGPFVETRVNGGGERLRVRTSRSQIRISAD